MFIVYAFKFDVQICRTWSRALQRSEFKNYDIFMPSNLMLKCSEIGPELCRVLNLKFLWHFMLSNLMYKYSEIGIYVITGSLMSHKDETEMTI